MSLRRRVSFRAADNATQRAQTAAPRAPSQVCNTTAHQTHVSRRRANSQSRTFLRTSLHIPTQAKSHRYRLWTEKEKCALIRCAQRFRTVNCRFDWVGVAACLHFRTPRQCMRQYVKLTAQLRGAPLAPQADSAPSGDMVQQLFAQAAGNFDFGFDPLFH